MAAALQFQVATHFLQAWGISASVSAFATLEDKPPDAWPITITSQFNNPDEEGTHLDDGGQPTAFVRYDEDWAVSASHEMLEILADSSCNRLISGPSANSPPRPVQYLIEVCDPVQTATYPIGDIQVCDFILPNFYGSATAGSRYDHNGTLGGPLQVMSGGYLSYQDDGYWWQVRNQNGQITFLQGPVVGSAPPPTSSREYVHKSFRTHKLRMPLFTEQQRNRHAVFRKASQDVRREKADALRQWFPVLKRIKDHGAHPHDAALQFQELHKRIEDLND